VKGIGEVDFINVRFEDAALTESRYKAIFSASAIHWVDPNVSWRKAAKLLTPNGTLILLQYLGLRERRSRRDLAAQIEALQKISPEIAAAWPRYYSVSEMRNGVRKLRNNISEVWSWLGNYDLGRYEAGVLFTEVEFMVAPKLIEHTPAELIALVRTSSPYRRLSVGQRKDLEWQFESIYTMLGRPIRSSVANVLVAAKRKPSVSDLIL
jgi:hypothetical protein